MNVEIFPINFILLLKPLSVLILLLLEIDFFLIRYDLTSYANLMYQYYQNSCRIFHNDVV